jgi:uncharacterized protein YqfA (UPF0365 family)
MNEKEKQMLLAVFDPMIIIVAVMTLMVVIVLAAGYQYVGLWLRAVSSGLPIAFLDIVGMQLRRINPRVVIRAMIMARQGGVDVSCKDMQRAYLQGADLEKIALALIEAKKQGIDITFDELLDADRSDRLGEKLKMPRA